MAQEQTSDCKRDRLWIGFQVKEMKYLIFLFIYSGIEIKRSIESDHLTRNASRIQRKFSPFFALLKVNDRNIPPAYPAVYILLYNLKKKTTKHYFSFYFTYKQPLNCQFQSFF